MTPHALATIVALLLGLFAAGFYFQRLKILRKRSRQAWLEVAARLGLCFQGERNEDYPLIEGSLDGVDLVVAVEREYVGYFSFHDTSISAALPDAIPRRFQMETRSSADVLRPLPAEIDDRELNELFHFPPPFPKEISPFLSAPAVREALIEAASHARAVAIEEGRFSLSHQGIVTDPDELEARIQAFLSLAHRLIDAATTSVDDGPNPSPLSQ